MTEVAQDDRMGTFPDDRTWQQDARVTALTICGLVLAVVGLAIFGLLFYFGFLALPFSLAGAICGVIAKRRSHGGLDRTLAVLTVVLSLLPLVFILAIFLVGLPSLISGQVDWS